MTAAIIALAVALAAAIGGVVWLVKLLGDETKSGKKRVEQLLIASDTITNHKRDNDRLTEEKSQLENGLATVVKELAREKQLRSVLERHRTDLLTALAKTSSPDDLARHLNDELRRLVEGQDSNDDTITPPQGTRDPSRGPVR